MLCNDTSLAEFLDAAESITVFIPTNDAFASVGITSPNSKTEEVVKTT
jgi:uncharacterized surface protein with fasciclin (FAS1) repeats